MSITESQKKAAYKYKQKNIKRIPFDVQKEKYEEIKSHSETRGETINGFIKRAIDETIQNDNHATKNLVDLDTLIIFVEKEFNDIISAEEKIGTISSHAAASALKTQIIDFLRSYSN